MDQFENLKIGVDVLISQCADVLIEEFENGSIELKYKISPCYLMFET